MDELTAATTVLQTAAPAGLTVTGLLALALYAHHRGWIVTGREHKAVLDERDHYRSRTETMVDAAERALDRLASASPPDDRAR